MNFEGVLEFKGTWRTYQARVLENAQRYLSDGKIHIVAAPGSGKTTLGIELIRRMNGNVLILAPSITIREQWVSRIEEAFLCDGCDKNALISQDLKNPKAITVATYQALHSAMTHFQGTQQEGEEDAVVREEVNYASFDLVGVMKKLGLNVLCLDECHHLKNEWWKALEDFRSKLDQIKIISLTATPPYDATPAMWTRYMNMCGEIDEEITIPELVKDGNLCPHQDYVYFNYPTNEEKKEIENFEKRSKDMMLELMQDDEFLACIMKYKGLSGELEDDMLLENPAYLSSVLIYLHSKHVDYPKRLQKLLGSSGKMPDMSEAWMEKLLQGFLYDDVDSYWCDNVFRELMISKLKSAGMIEKRKVMMTRSTAVDKLLTNSLGKCNSIKDIVSHEYDSMGKNLRLLVLTDYIKKEYEKCVGDETADVNALGVIPFFEMLRRENEKNGKDIRLGVLCGTIVIIPSEAKPLLEMEIGETKRVAFSPIGRLSGEDYLKVTAIGDAHFLTSAVTNIFAKGAMQVLIGTKSLLGEGWDSPCINSLILASFVGSFMLSNQMRGRAIRVWKDNPEKTSNIWHLVCLRPWRDVQQSSDYEISEDFTLLSRRMEHFLGLHYEEDSIETGIERLSVIKQPFDKTHVSSINKKMLQMSAKRDSLKSRWKQSLEIYEKTEVVEEEQLKDKFVTAVVFWDAILSIIISAVLLLVDIAFIISFNASFKTGIDIGVVILYAIFICIFAYMLFKLPKLLMFRSPLRRLKAFGKGILKALEMQGLLEETRSKVVVQDMSPDVHTIHLSGGTGRDKALFAQCVHEFFNEIDNQRYILVKSKGYKGINGYYAVPECFAKRKEDAMLFVQCMKPYIGSYELVYTRSEKGRLELLRARVKALANREERVIHKKKVKGAFE